MASRTDDIVPDSDLPPALRTMVKVKPPRTDDIVPESDLPPELRGPKFYTGPTELHAGHPVVQGAEEALRGVAFGAGEYGGGLLGAAGGTLVGGAGGGLVGGPPGALAGATSGAVVGRRVGSAAGAGTLGTLADALTAWINHKLYGREIDFGAKAIAEDFLINAGVSGTGAIVSKLLTGAIPAEAEAVREAGQTLGTAQRQFAEKTTAAGEKALSDLEKTQAQQLEAVTPQARQEVITAVTGRTPTTAVQAQAPALESIAEGAAIGPSPSTLVEQTGLRRTYFDIKDRYGNALSKQYDDLVVPHSANPAPVDSVRQVLNTWEPIMEQRANAGRPFPAAAVSLYKAGQEVAPRSFLDTAAGAVRGRIAPSAKAAAEFGLTDLSTASSTVGNMLALKRAASALKSATNDDAARNFASDLEDAAVKSFEAPGALPPDKQQALRNLNLQWADYKRLFPHDDIRAIATAQDPVVAGARIFSNPALTERLALNANPAERSTMLEAFGDWAHDNPEKVLAKNDTDAMLKARAYGALSPNSPLADPKAINYISATIDNIESAPQAQAAFNQAMQQEQEAAIAQGAPVVRNIGLAEAKRLGPMGRQLIRQVNAAKTPKEQAEIVTKYFTGMTPENFVQQLARQQDWLKPSLAKQLGGEPETWSNWLKRMATNPEGWIWIAGYGALSAATFGRPGFYANLAVLGTVPVLRRYVANMFVRGLKNPAAAREVLSATASAGKGLFRPLTRAMIKGTADLIGTDLVKLKTGKPLEPEGKPSTGKGVKSLDTSRAEHMAPTPSASDRAGEVMHDLGKGKTPEVHRDLSKGRLSLDETNRLVRHAARTDAMALVEDVPLTEAFDAAEVAEPHERALLLPLLQRRLQQELPKQRNMTLAANLARRFQNLQTMRATDAT